MSKNTSWEGVASWYDDYLGKEDTYQKEVILPNLLRVLNVKKGEALLDFACGQGYFSRETAKLGANVVGIDISESLINIAKSFKTRNTSYSVPSLKGDWDIKDNSIDKLFSILAIQNIKDINHVFYEAKRVLKGQGKFVMVLNHPTFRIPQESDWGFDEKKKMQFRKIYEYMSERIVAIVMNPGSEKNTKKSIKTFSFHRPLQIYFKTLAKNGFAVTRLEEWISHKESQKGPRKIPEDKARKEIPLFMMIEATKI